MTNPRDHTHHPHRVPGAQATDSAQVPWHGRDLSASGFEDDSGAADPGVLAALADPDRGPGAQVGLLEQLARARFVVPIVAEPAEVDASGEYVVETRVEMAAVTLVAPDGARALPVFSGIEALARWDPAARPVPITPLRAGQAAVEEECEAIVVDVAGPATRVLQTSMVWALAQGRRWLPAAQDPVVRDRVAAAVAGEPAVTAYEMASDTGQLALALTLVPGLAAADVTGVAQRLGEALAGDPEVRVRIDGLALRFT